MIRYMKTFLGLCFILLFTTSISSNASNDESAEPNVLDITAAFELTLKNNDLLSSRKASAAADKESLNQAWAGVYPSVSLSGVYGKGEYSTEFTPLTDDSFQRYGLQLVQPLFSLKKFGAIERQSKFVEYTNLSYSLEEQNTLLDMTYAFLELAKSQRLMLVYENELEEHKVKFKGLKAMLDRGLATKMDVLEATAKQDDILASLVTAQSQLLQNQKKLARLVGGQAVDKVKINESLWSRSKRLTNLNSWEKIAQTSSLNLKVAQYNLELSQLDASNQKAGYYPEINFRAAIDNTDSYESTFRDNKKVQIEMVWPIYEGGLTNSQIRAANQTVLSSKYALEDSRKMLKVQLNEVMTTLTTTVANIKALEKSLISNKLYLKSAEKGMVYGLRGVFEILDAKTRIFDTERKMVTQIYDNLRAQFEMMYLAGLLNPTHLEMFIKEDFTPDLVNQ